MLSRFLEQNGKACCTRCSDNGQVTEAAVEVVGTPGPEKCYYCESCVQEQGTGKLGKVRLHKVPMTTHGVLALDDPNLVDVQA